MIGSFVALSLAIIVVPGQDTAVTIRNTLGGGTTAGILTVFGVCAGQLVWVTAACSGATVIAEDEGVFLAAKLAGAAYLTWLGVAGLRRALRTNATTEAAAGARGYRTPLLQGVASNLSNPKALLFFIGFLPQFARRGSTASMAAFGVSFTAMTFLWLSVWVLGLGRRASVFRNERVRRVLDLGASAVLVALGADLLLAAITHVGGAA